ncbi:MAG TPA: stage II sporulation protein P [Candidatus Onthenecus intestinigallinarum]|uniref:Stage II sporulation protein P n=1 Tax=Candidatus Onthenecus intestinigallinarum TaxID=2840875 RepID=A0A9D1CR21_9FIRM|nr:stage II sporulation protein P [Candidatus Onthenecus intestinigallinarum]
MKRRILALFLALALGLPACALASVGDTAGEIYTVFTEDGATLFQIAGAVSVGDEYISAENQLYEIISVDEQHKTAVARLVGAEEMPDVSWLNAEQDAVSVYAQAEKKLIALYVTHGDESYVPTDGTESEEDGGGIYDVAKQFKAELEALGITVALDTSSHLPHDGGAYRRSRQTAVRLAEKAPDALIDIHRDGIPDPDEYTHTVAGDPVAKVRLLVGRANQNSAANRSFAKQIKAVADKMYPGLIKDIFIGKGNYNQEIMPHAILLEFGTHTISKERALASTELMANVLNKTLYGDVSPSASGGADTGGSAAARTDGAADSSEGAGSGIVWLLVVAGAAALAFAFLATGTGKGMGEKLKRNASELTGGLLGKRPDKDKPPE